MTIYDYPNLGYKWGIACALGQFKDALVFKKFGASSAVGSTLETVWDGGGRYVYPVNATIMQVSSESDEDTNITGNGAFKIVIQGLNQNWELTSEEIELTGQAQVPTQNQYIRIFRAYVSGASTPEGCADNIHIGVGAAVLGVPVTSYAIIQPIQNQTLMAIFTIPDGYIGVSLGYYANSGKTAEVEVDSFERSYGGVFMSVRKIGLYENSFVTDHPVPFITEARTDIEIRAKSSVSSTPIQAGFDIVLIKK